MNAIVSRLVELLAAQRPATADACEQLLAAQLSPGDQDQLRAELERALASRDQLKSYLRELEGRVARPSPCSDPLDDAVVTQVSQSGLSVLSPGQLARLAVSPMLLLALWDAIDDEGLSPHWLQTVRSSMQGEEQQRGRKFPTMQEMVASAKWAAAASPLRPDPTGRPGEDEWVWQAAGADVSPSPDRTSLPKRWEKDISLAQAVWLSRDDPGSAALVKNATAVLEFSWLAGDPPILEVRFVGGPLAFQGANCAASLVDRQGQEFAASRAGKDCLVFGPLPPGGPEALIGVRFACTYTLPGAFQLEIVVPVDPRVTQRE